MSETTAKVTFVDGLKFEATTGTGHTLMMDGPAASGGSDSAARPMELLLVGLGGCTGMDAISIMRKKKQPVESFVMNIKGTRADAHPMRYLDVEIEFVFKGKGIDESAVKRSVELSMEKYCSVKATLETETPVSFSYRVEE
jgi:putative redox protein